MPSDTSWPVEAACTAFIGAGGKTTTMLSMANAFAGQGARALITTTTKMWPPTEAPLVCTEDETDFLSAIRALFANAPIVAIGKAFGDRSKLLGIEPEDVCDVVTSGIADVVLCEADGSGGKPLKWHKPGEPVVPACTTLVVSIVGLDALGLKVREVHRPELFAEALDLNPLDTVGPMEIARALKATKKYVPKGSRLIYVLNKTDNEEARVGARQVAACLRGLGAREPVFCSRQGTVVEAFSAAKPATGFKT